MRDKLYRATLNMRDFVLQVLAPPLCVCCKMFLDVRDTFCKGCANLIHPIVSRKLLITKTRVITVLAISDYKEPLKSLILAKGRFDIVASHQLGALIWQTTHLKNMPFDYIVPIPLHWTRYARRGYNQADEMAKVLAQKSGKPIVHVLSRARRTVYQSELTQDKRVENVKDVFACSPINTTQYRDAHILLVDDLMTTGATLRAAARELLRLRPASITAVVACRVV